MDNEELAAIIALTAFVGAIVGVVGSFVAALTGDAIFGSVATTGAVVCAAIWWRHLRSPIEYR